MIIIINYFNKLLDISMIKSLSMTLTKELLSNYEHKNKAIKLHNEDFYTIILNLKPSDF